ncbi:MAG: hypothetical protein QME94_11950, partial [Anaerolineae bacterium]|nr:hypothetical protein [Anaerolineae bacterium]
DPQAAEAALRAGQIEAYYVIAPDYRDTGQVRRVSLRLSATPADPQWMSWLLAGNLVPDADAAQLMRLRYPFNAVEPRFVALSTTDGAEGSGNQMLPFVVTMAVMAPLLTGGSLLLGSLAQEKGSR